MNTESINITQKQNAAKLFKECELPKLTEQNKKKCDKEINMIDVGQALKE